MSPFDTLLSYLDSPDMNNPAVSAGSIYRHIDHCLRVAIQITQKCHASDPTNYRPHFSIAKYAVLRTGRIPRGRAKAPSSVIAPQQPTREEILQLAQERNTYSRERSSFNPQQFFAHPVFGHLCAKQAKQFLRIHTNHHLRIIKDILS